jgi:hypothetical protein
MTDIHYGTSVIEASGLRSFRDFGTSELRVLLEAFTLASFQSRDFRTSDFSILRAHIVQLSPTKAMARGTLRKVHITPGDVIRPHHVYPFTSKLQASEVCASTHSTSPDCHSSKLSLDHRRSLSLPQPMVEIHFTISCFGGVHLSSLPIFRFHEILKGSRD